MAVTARELMDGDHAVGDARPNGADCVVEDASWKPFDDTCEAILAQVDALDHGIVGWSRLRKAVEAEVAAIKRAGVGEGTPRGAGGWANGNLPQLRAVVLTCSSKDFVTTGTLRNMTVGKRMIVDVTGMLHGRPVWIKCIARSPSALDSQGSDFASLEAAAKTWLMMAKMLPEQSHVPRVCFRFFAGLPDDLAERLTSLGVDVGEGLKAPTLCREQVFPAVNLDTTVLVALASNLAHGRVGWRFEDEALEYQAEQEAQSPLLVELAGLLAGKQLYASECALSSFRQIVGICGGPDEKRRSEMILAAVSPVEDKPVPGVKTTRYIGARMLCVLGAGAQYGIPTCTASTRAVRSLIEQAAGLLVLQHMPRALTEQKEGNGSELCDRSHPLEVGERDRLFREILAKSVGSPKVVPTREPTVASERALIAVEHHSNNDYDVARKEKESATVCLNACSIEDVPVCTSRRFDFSAALDVVHDGCAADAGFEEAVEECMSALLATCSAAISAPEFKVKPFDWTPDVQLEKFGSTMQGTALTSSDVDVRMSFVQFAVHAPDRQLLYLEGVARALTPDFKLVKMIRFARLPVLRLQYRDKLLVDLTMGDNFEAGAEVDLVIRRLLEEGAVDDGAFRFVRLVKAFAKAHELIDAYGGFLNSVSWICIAIAFLQLESCLPPYQLLLDGQTPGRGSLWPVRLSAALFSRFFAFVEELGRYPHRISILTARHSYSATLNSPIFVEHPSASGRTLAQCLRELGWRRTVQFCHRARAALSGSRSLRESAVASSLFEQGSLSDSCGDLATRPREKGDEPPLKRHCRSVRAS